MAASVGIVGNVNVDLIVRRADTIPPPGMEWTVDQIELRTGGAAAITGLALARLGTVPRISSCVGDDELGRLVQRELAGAGVSHEIPTIEGQPTGVSIAFEAPGRDRSFLITLGSLQVFDASLVPDDVIASASVLFCGYFLLPALRGRPTAKLMRRVHDAGGSVYLDTGWDTGGWDRETRTEIANLLPLADMFLPNELEAQTLADTTETTDAVRILQVLCGGWVVVKCGAAGCVAAGPDGARLSIPAPTVEIVDTIGAGDAFNAGLIHALSAGKDVGEAIDMAVRVGSAVVSRPSTDRYPTARDLA